MSLMDAIMAKSLACGSGSKKTLELEVETILAETTVPVEYGVCQIAFPYNIGYGSYKVRVNGEEYGIFYHNGYGYYEGEEVYIDLETDHVSVTFNPHGNHPESVPEYATVSLTMESIPYGYIPEYVAPCIVDLGYFGIAEVILGLFMEGGGSAEVDDLEVFWNVLSVELGRNIHMVMNFQGSLLDIAGVTNILDSHGRCEQVCSNFLVMVNGPYYVVSTSIVRKNDGAIVYVKVT